MKNMRIGIAIAMVVFLAFAVALPVLACDQQNDNGKDDHSGDPKIIEDQYRHFGHDGFDERHHCKLQPPSSFSNVTNLTIDESLINATPHWMFLATGEDEQNALLSYIRQANVSRQQRGSWTMFLEQMWMKYPVRYVKTDNISSKIIPGSRISLNSRENATFREIEQYIAEDMDLRSNASSQTETIKPMWYAGGSDSTHQKFMRIPLNDFGGISKTLQDFAIPAADAPDTWTTGIEANINHGFVPTGISLTTAPTSLSVINGIGIAPDNFGMYASLAKMAYTAHNYQTAFTDMGYASHFISDVGEPFHTPCVQIMPLEFIDTPFSNIIFPNTQMLVNYRALHNAHENMVANDFNSFYDGNTQRYDIIEPTFSAKVHAVYSWEMNYPLVYACYWEFVKNPVSPDYIDNPVIMQITKNRVSETMKQNRGLVQYITGGQPPMLTVTTTAGPGGFISPSGSSSVLYGNTLSLTITPNPGYKIDQVIGQGTLSGSIFTTNSITTDQIISVTFKPIVTPTPTQNPGGTASWTWSTQGWGDWQPSWSITGPQVGPNSAYGPQIESNAAEGTYGIYGTNNNLLAGSTQSSITKTFTDPSGSGWNTITFDGLMTATDVLGGRWMTITVNGNQVFGGTAQQMPPGNNVPFEIKRSFPLSSTAIVTIANGQNPAWGPFFGMHYYKVAFSRENSMMSMAEDQNSPFEIPDGSIKVDNETVTEIPTTSEIPTENVTPENSS
ncbi:MAG TPA: hypothetical protein VEI81_01995 [Methanoregula sp.]|nr:hypothetical protein [Methanoregula sp.]